MIERSKNDHGNYRVQSTSVLVSVHTYICMNDMIITYLFGRILFRTERAGAWLSSKISEPDPGRLLTASQSSHGSSAERLQADRRSPEVIKDRACKS